MPASPASDAGTSAASKTSTQHYLIFGATGGVGSSICRQLAGAGHQLALSGRDASKLASLAQEVRAPFYPADATEWAAVEEVMRSAKRDLKGLDGVAVCVGSLLLKPAHMTEQKEFDAVLNANLSVAFGVVRSAVRTFMTTGGSIVLISSAAASIGIPNHEAIAAAKAAIEGLTRSAAATYAPRGIRVNCVAPGLIQTPLTQSLTEDDKMRKASEQMHPLGRLGNASEVAKAVTWLLSPEQDWVTGQVIGVDGGLAACLPRMRL
jgi:3-oxoacyl-[acyl-carrier protein] reductase